MILREYSSPRGKPTELEAFTELTVAAACPKARVLRAMYGIDPGRGAVVQPDFFIINSQFPRRPTVILETTGASLEKMSRHRNYLNKPHQEKVIYSFAKQNKGYEGLIFTGQNYSSERGYLNTLSVLQDLFNGKTDGESAKNNIERIARETPYVHPSTIDWDGFSAVILASLSKL